MSPKVSASSLLNVYTNSSIIILNSSCISNLLPQYLESYRDVIESAPARELRQHYIHPPLIRRVYAEYSPLFQLIKLINSLKADKNDTNVFWEKIQLKSHTFHGFSFNVTMVY